MEAKNALITGGSRGLGRAMAAALAHQGHRVAVTGRDDKKLKEVGVTKLGHRLRLIGLIQQDQGTAAQEPLPQPAKAKHVETPHPVAPAVEAETGAPIKGSITLADLLRRPGMHAADLVRHGLADADLPLQVREGAEIDIKYSGYLQRQQQQIDQVKRQGQRKLPEGINYDAIGTLSREAREKLAAVRPLTLGQASQIPGVSQADLTALLMWLELRQRRNATNSATSSADLAPTANSR